MTTSIDITPYLESIGLTVKRAIGPEAICLCPAHADTSGKFSFHQTKLVGHCWVCDFRVPSLDVLAEYMTGRPADRDVIVEAQSYSLGEAVKTLGQAKTKVLDAHRVLEWKWKQLRPVPAQLLAFRRLSEAMAAWFDVRFDPTRRCWAIPIHTPTGTLMGWQERQKGGFSNYPAGMKKSGTLFGLHRYDTDRLALVESPLDAVRMFQAGVPAVASFGAEVSNAQIELLARHCSEVYVALDNDEPGQKAAERVLKQLRRRVGAVPWRYTQGVKDPGDYPNDQEIRDAWTLTKRYGLGL
jgi:hypothetical protein